jgi:PBP1b-binding outer membrane lipoprotein LpoB
MRNIKMKSLTRIALLLVCIIALSGCANMTPYQSNTDEQTGLLHTSIPKQAHKKPIVDNNISGSQVAYFAGGIGAGSALGVLIAIVALGAIA